jgi:hypothetical protein
LFSVEVFCEGAAHSYRSSSERHLGRCRDFCGINNFSCNSQGGRKSAGSKSWTGEWQVCGEGEGDGEEVAPEEGCGAVLGLESDIILE